METLWNLGATWEVRQLAGIAELNSKYKGKARVVEVYGSLGGWATARAQDRIPPYSIPAFNAYLDGLKETGISLKWTMNMSCFGGLQDLHKDWPRYTNLIRTLSTHGQHRYIVTVPLLARLILKEDPEAEIEVSTITRIHSAREIQEWCKQGVKGFCWDVMENRSFSALAEAIKVAHDHEAYMEVIVNEFCTFLCIHRNTCYNLSSHDSDRGLFGGYPFQDCIDVRDQHPWEWIAARFILPSDIQKYTRMGVDRFKCTGRTHPTDVGLHILGYYMAGEDPDNLLDLWPHINKLVKDPNNPPDRIHISCKRLKVGDFLCSFNDDCQSVCPCGVCESLYKLAGKEV